MDGNTANPLIVILMFLGRCLIPLLIMLGISYVLKKLGLIQEPPPPPGQLENSKKDEKNREGDLAHGKA